MYLKGDKAMKKIIVLALVVLLAMGGTTYAQRASSLNPGIGDIMGQKGLQNEGNKIFYMVNNDAALPADTVAGSIVIWDTTLDDGVTVNVTTTSYDSRVAGVLVQATLTPEVGTIGNTAAQQRGRRNWGWLQTYGASEVRVETVAGTPTIFTVGEAIAPSSTAGEATVYDVLTPTGVQHGVAGFALDAGTTGEDDVEVFLRCM